MVFTVCICGGGNGSHVAAAYIGTKPNYRVHVYTRRPEDWKKGMAKHGNKLKLWHRKNGEKDHSVVYGSVAAISDNPADVVASADLCLLGGPAQANVAILKAIAPHVKLGATVGALFAQGGFNWAAQMALGGKINDVTLFGMLNIPWICRALEYGSEAKIVGPKNQLHIACQPHQRGAEMARLVTDLFDIPTSHSIANFLSLTLTPSNQIIHPARYFGIFRDWDRKTPYNPKDIPVLYEDLDQFSADILQNLDNELQAIVKELSRRNSKLDLSGVPPIAERIVRQYGDDVADKSTLKSIFNTNKGYAGVATPVTKVDGGVVPNTNHRVFWEDIPYGLCILKDIAEMIGVPTPEIDRMMHWHQSFMGKEYIKGDKLNRELLRETGAPSAYGLNNIQALLRYELAGATPSKL